MSATQDFEPLLVPVLDLAGKAGAAIMRHYGPQIEVRTKADASPVTAADDEAEAIIEEELRRLTPEIAVVSEEAFAL